jgi:stage III sporulation protein AB
MWLKFTGSVLIVFVTSCIGFEMAARCTERPRHLRQIISCLGALKSYVIYTCLPLHEALSQCTNGTNGPVAEFFQNTAMMLEQNATLTPQQVINTVLGQMQGYLILNKSEIEVLNVLGGNLGVINREEQEQYLSMVIQQLERFEGEAVKIRDINTKMYRYLGICGGLALVILLV